MTPIELECRPKIGRATRVEIGIRLLADLRAQLGRRIAGRRTCMVFDRRAITLDSLPDATCRLERDGGESIKRFSVLEELLDAMSDAALDRGALLVGIGGGSLGDVTGLAAALYLRGIEHWQIPTTLLAMVDSSVGGKTAINLHTGKNLVGHYWPASTVLIDPQFVATLPDAEFRSGLGEVLKVAIGLSPELYALCERHADALLRRDVAIVAECVRLAIGAKIRVVEQDPDESGPRRLLNLGHTLGHALEAESGYSSPHGIAVARGLRFAIERAEQLGVLGADDATRSLSLLERFGFVAEPLPPWTRLEPFLRRDKKIDAGVLNAILPDGIGSCRSVAMDLATFRGAAR